MEKVVSDVKERPQQRHTLNDRTMSPGKGETAALPHAGHSARFSISGQYPAVVQSTCCDVDKGLLETE